MNQMIQQPSFDVIEQVMISGDLSGLQPQQRTEYYNRVCDSVGLNPLTQPFAYIKLNGKLSLYAKKDATDQLSKLHGVSVRIVDKQLVNDVYLVDVEATDKDGRVTADMGAVPVQGLQGERLANAMMKAITKAKRRATLSICGLGWLDETETDTMANAPTFTVEESHRLPEQSTAATAAEFHAVTGHQPTEKPEVRTYEERRKAALDWAMGQDVFSHVKVAHNSFDKMLREQFEGVDVEQNQDAIFVAWLEKVRSKIAAKQVADEEAAEMAQQQA